MTNEKRRKIAQSSLLLRNLPDQYVETLLSLSSWREYERGETLFYQGDKATAIHVVVDGWVKLYRIAPNGGEAVVHVFTKGESFGEAVAIKEREYPVSAEAVTTCQILRIPSSALLNAIRKEPEVAITILASTFSHLHTLVSQVEQLKAKTGPQRVAEFLLDLCGSEPGNHNVTLPYDKALIAGRLGMKPESLSRSFARLRNVGVEVKRNHADIADVERLREFVEADHTDL